MEHRFRFKAPTPRELAFHKRWKWVTPAALCALFCLEIFGGDWLDAKMSWLALAPVVVLLLLLVGLSWRLEDIRRRDVQWRVGVVELTPLELRISRSARSLFRVKWPDLTSIEERRGHLQIHCLEAQFGQEKSLSRLDRLPLRELEAPGALLELLRAQTASH